MRKEGKEERGGLACRVAQRGNGGLVGARERKTRVGAPKEGTWQDSGGWEGWPRGAAARRSGAVVPHPVYGSVPLQPPAQRPNRLAGWLTDWLAGWLVGRSVGRSVSRLAKAVDGAERRQELVER